MPLKDIETQQHEIRLTLNMPHRGRVIIEGGQKTVLEFWSDVKLSFTNQITEALKSGFTKGEAEIVVTETSKSK